MEQQPLFDIPLAEDEGASELGGQAAIETG